MRKQKIPHIDDLKRICRQDGCDVNDIMSLDWAKVEIVYEDDNTHYEKLSLVIDVPAFKVLVDYMTGEEKASLYYPPNGSAIDRLDYVRKLLVISEQMTKRCRK